MTGRTLNRITMLALLVNVAAARAAADNSGDPHNTGMSDPAAVAAAYDRYIAKNPDSGVLTIPLVSLRGIVSETFNAGGNAVLNFTTKTITANVQGLPGDASFDLFLVNNHHPGSTLAEAGDVVIAAGTLVRQGARNKLAASLNVPAGFFPDRAFVVRSSQTPAQSFVLTGSANFFERLRRHQVAGVDPTAASRVADLAAVMAEGRRLFTKETFAGNGRSCGTCHVESNNFTIDPEFIAKLPRTDPLFVAETNPALTTLENPDLLRRFGLVIVNADGFDPQRRFVLRSVQNVQALSNSTTAQDPSFGIDFSTNGRNPNPPERLGWGNDAAPLHDFPLVAIVQHATRTLARQKGHDFRAPTDEELDALAAYQLGIGRQEDFELKSLQLNTAIARTGKALYLDTGDLFQAGHKNCNACHFNAGGTAGMSFNPAPPGYPHADASPAGFNIAAPTGVNDIPLAISLGLPRDGGFGQLPTTFGSFGNTDDFPPPIGHLEIEEFNTPSIVESADTGPFFHNHTVADLESAVAFYGTPAFQQSLQSLAVPVNISGDANDPQVQAIAALLRVLNGLENVRSSINIAERGQTMARDADARDLAKLAVAETADAIKVLGAGALASSHDVSILAARGQLTAAFILLQIARDVPPRVAVNLALAQAVDHLRSARRALADETTLPASYRN